MQEEKIFFFIILLFIAVIMLIGVMLHTAVYRMAKIYNWNGKRYCYLGYVPISREDGGFAVRLGEHMVDLSRTTLYAICPSMAFRRKNRYGNLFVYADGSRQHVVVTEEEMKTEIPF